MAETPNTNLPHWPLPSVSHPPGHHSLTSLPTPTLLSQAPQLWEWCTRHLPICLCFACSLQLKAEARVGERLGQAAVMFSLFPLLLISPSLDKSLFPKTPPLPVFPSTDAPQDGRAQWQETEPPLLGYLPWRMQYSAVVILRLWGQIAWICILVLPLVSSVTSLLCTWVLFHLNQHPCLLPLRADVMKSIFNYVTESQNERMPKLKIALDRV